MFEKWALKWLIYWMIWTTILWWVSWWLLNQAHWYQWENWRNADAVKWYKEFQWLKSFWWTFVPAVEKSARQKWISSVEMMNKIVTILDSFIKSPKSTDQQIRNWTILLAFAKDYVEAAWNSWNQSNQNLIAKQREEAIKRQREEEQKKAQQQNLNKWNYNKQVNNWFEDINEFEFTNNQSSNNNQNNQNNNVNSSNILKEITRWQSSSNELYLELEFDKFVDTYMKRWLSKQDATREAEKAFSEIYSYVSKWDVEWTLNWYVRLRNKYNIQRTQTTWWHQSASETWYHKNWACNWKTNLANLMLVMWWIQTSDISRVIVNSNHVRLNIRWFSRDFDSVSAWLNSNLWNRNTDWWSYNWWSTWSYQPSQSNDDYSSSNNNNSNSSSNLNSYNDNSSSNDWVEEFDFT